MNQIAMSVRDLPRTHAWYTAAFGFVPSSGTNAFKGYIAEKVQGVKGARSCCWWLGDQQDFFQLELFQFERPETRSVSDEWRPCDIGYSSLLLQVQDFDETLARLKILNCQPITPPLGEDGSRRVCVRDPEGVLLELFEVDPLQNRSLPVHLDVPVLTLGVTVSVPDLEKSLTYFRDVLGMVEAPDQSLHKPLHEAMWGLENASSRRCVLLAGDSIVELVQYTSPVGEPMADDYRISDQGLLNIALGFRSKKMFRAVYNRCLNNGITGNWRPLNMGAWNVVYVNDEQGFSVELLQVQPWYDGQMGFSHRSASPNLSIERLRSLTIEMAFDVPKERALEALADHESMGNWWPQKTVTLLKDGDQERNGVGAVRQMSGLGAVVQEEIVAWQDGAGYDYKLLSGAPLKDHFGSIRVLPSSGSSLVQWRIEFRPLIPGTGAVMQWFLRRLIVHAVNKLKRQLESEPVAVMLDRETI
jgi:catechol 2,3-dioxygenase-like lactoylglutathione lyase family enzyme